jgi:anti-anti-sigma factor
VNTDELAKLRDMVRHATKAFDHNELRLDFDGIEFVSSDFLVALVRLRRSLEAAGKQLTLCNLSSSVAEVLTVTGLGRLFHFAQDRPTANPNAASPHGLPGK